MYIYVVKSFYKCFSPYSDFFNKSEIQKILRIFVKGLSEIWNKEKKK